MNEMPELMAEAKAISALGRKLFVELPKGMHRASARDLDKRLKRLDDMFSPATPGWRELTVDEKIAIQRFLSSLAKAAHALQKPDYTRLMSPSPRLQDDTIDRIVMRTAAEGLFFTPADNDNQSRAAYHNLYVLLVEYYACVLKAAA